VSHLVQALVLKTVESKTVTTVVDPHRIIGAASTIIERERSLHFSITEAPSLDTSWSSTRERLIRPENVHAVWEREDDKPWHLSRLHCEGAVILQSGKTGQRRAQRSFHATYSEPAMPEWLTRLVKTWTPDQGFNGGAG
jgi:hypothetical protein